MRERPKTLNVALQLACQYQGLEESQKRLHGVSAKVETMAVGHMHMRTTYIYIRRSDNHMFQAPARDTYT